MKFTDYPFTPMRFDVRPGIAMSYLDEGPRDGEVVVMLHGNPSWSYYWRHLVLGLRDTVPRMGAPMSGEAGSRERPQGKGYRCIVPDHIGMGLSDKPGDAAHGRANVAGGRKPGAPAAHGRANVAGGRKPGAPAQYEYTLQSRIDDLDALLARLDVGDKITLAVHDWGGMIGFGWALKNAARVRRLVILNTGAFPMPAAKVLPWQLKLGRDSMLGALMIRGFNAFAAGAAKQGVVTPMPTDVRGAYLAPYDSWANRIATLRFVQDIPLAPADRAWALVEESGRRLHEYANRPTFIGWGLRDFVFDRHFLDGFTAALPNAEVHAFEDAGHYVLEDKRAVLVPAIRAFLDSASCA